MTAGIKLRFVPWVKSGAATFLKPGPHVRLTVVDDGPGLEKSARELFFHPFHSRRSGGTKVGLEMFLVREAVQAHLGEIFVESDPGQGLVLQIYLPAARE